MYVSFLFAFERTPLDNANVSKQKFTRHNVISSIRTSQNHYNVIKMCVDRGQVYRCAYIHSKHLNSSKTTGLNADIIL